MKLIKPSFEIWEQELGLKGIYKAIERAGRVCYKSEDKITEDSAEDFVDRMIKSQHYAMLEHGTVYLKVPYRTNKGRLLHENITNFYLVNKYSSIRCIIDDAWYITTNYRVIIENKRTDDLKYLHEPTEFHEKRITVHFVCDRGVSHKEFVA